MGEAEEAGSLRTTDRIVDWLDKAKKLVETLSPWHDREKISGWPSSSRLRTRYRMTRFRFES